MSKRCNPGLGTLLKIGFRTIFMVYGLLFLCFFWGGGGWGGGGGLTPRQQPGSCSGEMMMMKYPFYWWRNLEHPEETTDLRQITDKLSNIRACAHVQAVYSRESLSVTCRRSVVSPGAPVSSTSKTDISSSLSSPPHRTQATAV